MIILAVTTVLAALTAVSQTSVTIDAEKPIGHVPALIYGAGMEDVNHEIYGGLYDQRIFGESFEEPAVPEIKNFTGYDGLWSATGGVLRLSASDHGKLISQLPATQNSSATVKLKFEDPNAIAGLIMNVSDASNGVDAFRGYEISLNAAKQRLVIGKHNRDWQPVAEVPVKFNPNKWNSLRADFQGNEATVWLNGRKIYEYKDFYNPLICGQVGARTFGGHAIFKELEINGRKAAFRTAITGVSSMWVPIGRGRYGHEREGSFHGKCHQKITGKPGDGIANLGLNKWGIGVMEGQTMTGHAYLKGDAEKAFVALQSRDGSKEYARCEVSGIVPDEWRRFEFELAPSATDCDSRFAIALGSSGTLEADMVMLCTDSYPFRRDITEEFKKEGLTFLRYGGTMVNAPEYRVKNMMGQPDKRPPYTGHWYPNSTNGFGIIEFVKFARLIGAEPAFAINIEDNPQDVLALLKEIEPYSLRYIEIGNEENIWDESPAAYEHYVKRFNTLYDAIHPVYPDLVFINAAWWRSDKPEIMQYVFRNLDGKSALWDYHPWTDLVQEAQGVERDLESIKCLFKRWNPESRMHIAILEENGNTHCQHRALSHAVMLNVVRRMNGFLELDSPANALQAYLQNDNGWDQGQIFFNSSATWCQPPYYAQQMAAKYHQPILVASEADNPNLDLTATRSEDGRKLALHIVNFSPEPQTIDMNLLNAARVKTIHGESLSGNLKDINTPEKPHKITPKGFTLAEPRCALEPYSYTVIAIECEAN